MGSETPGPTQIAVLARHLNGERNNKIAEDLGISPNTVSRILSDGQVERIHAETKSILLRGSQGAAKRIIKVAAKDHNVGFELLDRLNILAKPREGAATQVNVALGFEGMAAPYAKESKEKAEE